MKLPEGGARGRTPSASDLGFEAVLCCWFVGVGVGVWGWG